MTIEQEDAMIPIGLAKTRRSSPVEIENKSTRYYSAGEEQQQQQQQQDEEQELADCVQKKRGNSNEEYIADFPRKLSKMGLSNDCQESVKSNSTTTTSTSWQQLSPLTPPDFVPTCADFKKNEKAFGFLQSLSPSFDSSYLYESAYELEVETKTRAGFLLGRSPSCDLVFDDSAISKRHCLIYMETGTHGQNKGIRIYLKDMSFNGTFVNNKKVSHGDRVVLKNNDIIQLRVPETCITDWNRPRYRMVFPKSYDADRCENLYEMGKLLGSGNFASVYAAKEKSTGNLVAVKRILRTRYDNKPKLLQSVIQETGTLMSFEEHPFIIQIQKTYLEEKYFYLVLEYSPDGDLFNYITEHKRLSERKTRFLFWQLFQALKFLHNRGVAHRDLKPENVLMVNKQKLHIKIADFGLARHTKKDQSFTSQCGTPNYVAPEVLLPSKGRAYDERCDLWSLGVILYICLCGYPPFTESEGLPMKEQILKGDYKFDSRHWQQVSMEGISLVKALMTVDQDQRISLADAMEHPWMKLERNGLHKDQTVLGLDLVERSKELCKTEDLSNTMMIQ